MATFGESVRRERELRGITLPELANATKISLRHLQALEADRFDQLPGGIFNRGFVRAVARYMKMDERHWVGEYARAAHEQPEILARYTPPNAKPPASSHRGVWSFLLLVMLFGAGAYAVHEARQRAAEASPVLMPPSRATQPQTQSSAEPAEPARGTGAVPEAEAKPTVPKISSPARSFATPKELVLQVDALEDAWVSIIVDGRQFYSGIMKPGETRTFHAAERVEVTTGNASAVILTLNGETLPPLGNPGERRNLTLTARDLQQLAR